MPIRRPNLLDAFRRATDVPAPPAGPGSAPARGPSAAPERPAREPAVAGEAPRATPAPVVPAPAARPAPAASVPLRSPPRERLVLLALALAVATLTLVWMVRSKGGADPVQASEGSSAPAPAASATPAPPTQAAPTPPALAPADAVLYDKKNGFTVRLIQYPNDKTGNELAGATYHFLTGQGIPVAKPILLDGGKWIVLCAGAKPTRDELVALREHVRGTRYPTSSKTMPFATAYIDEIDDVLKR